MPPRSRLLLQIAERGREFISALISRRLGDTAAARAKLASLTISPPQRGAADANFLERYLVTWLTR